jgi:serine/threonine protein phosphatase PrpC
MSWRIFQTSDTSEYSPLALSSLKLMLFLHLGAEIESILIEEMVSIDQELVKLGDEHFQFTKGGSTCVISVLTSTEIIVANIGDSPAIVFSSDGRLLCQSEDHNPDNRSEYARISALGANIVLSNEFGDLRVRHSLILTSLCSVA